MHEGTIWITDTHFGEVHRSLSAFNAPGAALTYVIPAASALAACGVQDSGDQFQPAVWQAAQNNVAFTCCLCASENIESDFWPGPVTGQTSSLLK